MRIGQWQRTHTTLTLRADAADAEGFLLEMMLCFSRLGLSVFTAASPIQKSSKLLFITAKGIKAEGMETHGRFRRPHW